jgi:polysaccharide biosynthesis transport protein
MTLSQFFLILRARWRSALLVFATLVVATVAVSLILPKQYTATATVYLDVKSPDPIMGAAMAAMMMPSYMASQVDLIQSERVGLRAMRSLGLDKSNQLQELWREATEGEGNFDSWAVETLQKKLLVKPSRESSVINVSYSASDPKFAAALANAWVKGFVDTSLELRVDPARQYSDFFDDRAKKLRDSLEAAQSRYSDYQRSKGIFATDERLDVENSRLNELSTQLVMLQALAVESSSREAQTVKNGDRLQEVFNNPVVSNLTVDLARQEARLQELSERQGENHPQVLELKANISQLKSKIASQAKEATGSVGVSNNINQSRVAQLRASLDAQRAKVLRMKSERDEATVLQRDVEAAQRAYEAVVARGNQSALESQSTQTNISVLKQATEPSRHSTPNLLLNSAVAVFVGVLLAVGTALLRELIDRRLRTEDDIVEELGQQLLVVLPRMKFDPERAETGRVKQLRNRVMDGLPKPSAS